MRTVVEAIADSHLGPGTLTVTAADPAADTTVTWATVHNQALRMASVLAGHGAGPGTRVGLLGDTSVGLIAALQGCWLSGTAATVLPPPGNAGQPAFAQNLLAIQADAQLDLIVVDSDTAEHHAAGAVLAGAARVLALPELELAAHSATPATAHRPSHSDLAVLQYTSGSTRSPRGVPVTHGNLAANLDAIQTAIRYDASTSGCWLSWLPLYHDMGLIGFLALPMSAGWSLVLQSPRMFARRPASWLERIAYHRAACTAGPNFAYGLMTKLLEAGLRVDLSSVRRMYSGGEPIDTTMMARFAAAAGRCGLDPAALIGAYGLAESTLAVSFSQLEAGVQADHVDPEQLERHGRAVPASTSARPLARLGGPVAGTRLRITDPATGQPVPACIVGQVEVSGPSVVGHYWGEPAPPPGSWLGTGDLGYLTEDGELVVCGRAKDVLFAAGRNVYPQDVEAIAAQVLGVRPNGAAAFGIPSEQGDRLVLAIEARGTDPGAVRAAVTAAVTAETGMTPLDVITLRPGKLPKTSSGKLRRAETRRRYLSGDLPTLQRSIR